MGSSGTHSRGRKRESPVHTPTIAQLPPKRQQQGHVGVPSFGGVHSNLVPDDAQDVAMQDSNGNPYPSLSRSEQQQQKKPHRS
jgi:hypothetical protein